MKSSTASMKLWIKQEMNNLVLSLNSMVPSFEAAKLLEESKAKAIVVIENKIPVGIVTNKDLAIKIIAHSYPLDTPIRRIMSSPLVSISPETDIIVASELMSSQNIRKLPVIANDDVMGIIVASEISPNITNL